MLPLSFPPCQLYLWMAHFFWSIIHVYTFSSLIKLFQTCRICPNLFKSVQIYLNSFKCIQTCSKLLKIVQTCFNWFKLTQFCSNLFKLFQNCSTLFKLIQTCSNFFKIVQTCWKLVTLSSLFDGMICLSLFSKFLSHCLDLFQTFWFFLHV